jgi:hypothetical protein
VVDDAPACGAVHPRTRPVTEMELTTVDQSGTPIWLDVSCFSGDRVRFAVSD